MSGALVEGRKSDSFTVVTSLLADSNSMADMLERNALRSAEVHASQAGMFIDQAMRISRFIRPIPRVNIAQGWVLSESVGNINAFTF